MITINLLPVREERRKQDLLRHASLVVLLAGLALVVVAVQHAAVKSKVSARKKQVASLNAETENYKSRLAEVEDFKKQKKKIEKKLDVIEKLNRERSGPVRVLDELATRTPANVSLKELVTQKGVITLKGVGLNNEEVADYLSALEESDYFDDVKLETIKRTGLKGLKVSTFEIRAKLVAPKAKDEKAVSDTQRNRDRAEVAG